MTAPPRSLLRRPDLARLWLAGLVNETGDWLLMVALPLHVLGTTGSPLATSTVFILGLAPSALFGPLAGVLVDRWDRRRTLVVTALLQAGTLLPLVASSGGDHLWIVYAVAFSQSMLSQISEPARLALLPELVPPEELAAANGLLATGASLARLVGAALGGLVLEQAGLAAVTVADAATFAATALLVAGIAGTRAERRPRAPGPGRFLHELADGARLVARRPPLRVTAAVFALVGATQGIFVVGHVLFIVERLHGSNAEAGLLRGVQAVGGLAGGALVAVVAARWPPERLLSRSLTAFAAVELAIWTAPALSTALPVYVALFVAVGVPVVAFNAAITTIVQVGSPPRALGRVAAVQGSLYAVTQAASAAAAGALIRPVGLLPVLLVQPVFLLVAAVLAGRTVNGRVDAPAPT